MKRKSLILVLSSLALASCGGASSSYASGLSVQQSSDSGLSTQQSSASESSASQSASESSASQSQSESSASQSQSESSVSSSDSSSASSSDSSSAATPVTLDFTGIVSLMNDPENSEKEFTFHYDSSDFTKDNKVFNPNLAMLGIAMTNASSLPERATAVFGNAGFDEHLDISTLEGKPTIDSVGFAIGSRTVNGSDQIIVAFRGEHYGAEWSSNLYAMPSEEKDDYNGDHYGFHVSALKAKAAIEKFITDNELANPTYLLTGYSRGAAIADLTAAMLIDDGNEDNVYCYTYCTPAPMLASNDKDAYNAIFNFVNPNDMVPMLMPASYGFVRPGIEIDITKGASTFSEIFQAYELYDPQIDEGNDFAYLLGLKDEEGNPLNSGKDSFGTLLSILTREVTPEEIERGCGDYDTLEKYRDNLQTPARELIEDFLSFTDLQFSMETIAPLLPDAMEALQNLWADDGFDEEEPEVEYDPHKIATLVKKILASQNYYPEGEEPEPAESSSSEPATIHYYDGERMNRNADAAQKVLRNMNIGLTMRFIDQGETVEDARTKLSTFAMMGLAISKAKPVICRHAPDTVYALVRNYCETINE